MKPTYLALGIRFGDDVTNSIGTDSQFPNEVVNEFCKKFNYGRDYFDSIFLIRDNEVIFHWRIGEHY